MDDFGKWLKRLRTDVDLGPSEVARAALGDRASEKALRNFASYLLRIERGAPAVQNPKLDIIERLARGLGLTIPDFFARIEALQSLARPGQDRTPPTEQADHATPLLAPAAVDLAPFEAFGTALGKSLGEQLAGANRKRKDPTRARKKPGGRRDDRGDARRRV